MRVYILLGVGLLLLRCGPAEKTNRFSDAGAVRIGEFQDRRQADSLLPFLHHTNPLYRQWACDALASVQDSFTSVALGTVLLEDSDSTVRAAAAFALGQIGGRQAVNALIPALTDATSMVRREALEALGKSIEKPDLPSLKEFTVRDTLDEQGLSWALYRVGIRGLLDSALVQKAAALLATSKSYFAQLGAAHTFARNNFPLLQEAQAALITSTTSLSPEIRMAAVFALRKFVNPDVRQALIGLFTEDQDYRVRVSAIRSLRFFDWAGTQAIYPLALRDSSHQVAIAAAEVLRLVTTKENKDAVYAWALETKNPRAQAHLLEAVMTVDSSTAIVDQARSIYEKSDDNYQKSWLLAALAKSPKSLSFVQDQLLSSEAKIVKSSAATAVVQLNRHPDLKNETEAFVTFYQRALQDGDLGVIISVCDALIDPELGFKKIIGDFSFLRNARQRLSLPRDFEAIEPLEKAIAFFEDKTVAPVAKEFNHPIAWDSVKKISSTQKIRLQTNKGDIELRLFVDEAPGSVLNFVQLVRQGYFNEKFAHRVVPNFVVQAGCHRGDGYGSEDYSIRSEFSRRRYTTGSVGMASAGKDTEGTQWFITHSPTPHLDGAYSIFGEVVKGMDVVHQLEVGDQIVRASVMRN